MTQVEIRDVRALNPGYKIETMETQIGICKICNEPIKAMIPANVLVQVSEKPLFCEKCRLSLLRLLRPDSKELINLEKNKQ